MKSMILYPSNGSHKKSAAVGLFNFFLAYQFFTWAPEASIILPAFFALIGTSVMATTAWRYFAPTPSFEADARGFWVMGQAWRPWSAFRGVSVRVVRIGFFPVARMVVIRTGKSILGRRVQIQFNRLSAPAEEMAADIAEFSRHQIALEQMAGAFDPVAGTPVVPPSQRNFAVQADDRTPASVTEKPARISTGWMQTADNAASTSDARGRPFMDRIADSGPISTPPRLSERIFGRRRMS